MPFSALIFDFDGLILETEEPVFQSWFELYESYGCQLSIIEWQAVLGTAEGTFDPLAGLEAHLGRPLDRGQIIPRRRQRETELISRREVSPGVEQYLASARRLGLKVGLASSSSCAWVTGHLDRLGLIDYFDSIMARDDVRRTKPEPELYQRALDALSVEASQAIAFEDSQNGVLSAKRAGLYCVAVPNALNRRLAPIKGADLHLTSLADLPLEALLKRVEGT